MKGGFVLWPAIQVRTREAVAAMGRASLPQHGSWRLLRTLAECMELAPLAVGSSAEHPGSGGTVQHTCVQPATLIQLPSVSLSPRKSADQCEKVQNRSYEVNKAPNALGRFGRPVNKFNKSMMGERMKE